MAWKESHKIESRQRILNAAGDLFTRKGFNQVGIDEVMIAAGLTRGAFYAHFTSKIELYEEAILAAGRNAAEHFNQNSTDLNSLVENYLSDTHLHADTIRCPIACLVSDVAHDDERVREVYTRLFKGFTQQLQQLGSDQDDALMQAVLMVGGMALARSLTDKKLARKVLHICAQAAQRTRTCSSAE